MRGKRVTLTLDERTHRMLAEIAEREGRSQAKVAGILLETALPPAWEADELLKSCRKVRLRFADQRRGTSFRVVPPGDPLGA